MTTQAMVPAQPVNGQHMALIGGEKLQLLTDTICKGATAGELGMFVEVCNRLRLDPFAKQIHAVKRWDSKLQREVFSFQVGIDGFRLVAQRTGEMDGVEGPFWCGPDGDWTDLWTLPDPPFAAKVAVYRKGIARPFVGIAKYDSYVSKTKDGNANSMWAKFGDAMLAKCAEALALRRAFPAELSGVYAEDEADEVNGISHGPPPIQKSQPKKNPAPASAGGAVNPPAAQEPAPVPAAAAQPPAAPASSPATEAKPTKREAVVGVVEITKKSYQPPEKDGVKPPAKPWHLIKIVEGATMSEASSWDSKITAELEKARDGGLPCAVTIATNGQGKHKIEAAKAQEPGGGEEQAEAEQAV